MIGSIALEMKYDPDFFIHCRREPICYRMKNFKCTALTFCLFMFLAYSVVGQDSIIPKAIKEKIKVKKYTVLEKFEEELVVPVEDRIQLKEDRIVRYIRTKELLDTLNISESKRRKLIRDLRRSPIFSERLNKVIAETKFEDDNDIEE